MTFFLSFNVLPHIVTPSFSIIPLILAMMLPVLPIPVDHLA